MSVFHLTILFGYAVAALAMYVALRGEPEEGALMPSTVGLALGLGASLLHGRQLIQAIIVPEGWMLDVPNTVSLYGWELGLVALVTATNRDLRALSLPMFTVAGLASLLTGFGGPGFVVPDPGVGVRLHVLLSLLAYGLLGTVAALAGFLLYQDRRLQTGQLSGWLTLLPPLYLAERLLFGTLMVGWALLTCALLVGLTFLDNIFAQHLVHKTALSIIGWLILAVLIGGRLRWGWRGRRALHWVLGAFAVLLVAYFGSKAVLEEILGRSWGA